MAAKAFKEAIPVIVDRLGCTKSVAIAKLKRYTDHMSVAKAVSAILDGVAPPKKTGAIVRSSHGSAHARASILPLTHRMCGEEREE
jgi:hypothetical protein